MIKARIKEEKVVGGRHVVTAQFYNIDDAGAETPLNSESYTYLSGVALDDILADITATARFVADDAKQAAVRAQLQQHMANGTLVG